MSSSRSSDPVQLQVEAASETTEIFVVDSRFNRLASGIGSLEVGVPPGYYKIRFRAGTAQHDQLVEVDGSREREVVHGKPVAYQSALPIPDTSTSRGSHVASAERISHQLHARPGRDSQLLIFVRDLDADGTSVPWEGVSIHTLDGAPIATLEDGERSTTESFGALSLEVDPGTYRVRVETGQLGVFEMFAVTCSGWQTQVFSLVENFVAGAEKVRRASLRSASVLMTRIGLGLDAYADELRLADHARLGLLTGRKVVRSDLNALLRGKFDNPMLGLYGAHLLLAHRPDHRLIDEVTENLRDLVGSHPDVMALTLRGGAPESDHVFSTPPMLRSSWDLIVQASRRRISLVPPGSPSDRFSDGLLPSQPWLLHRVPEVPVEVGSEPVSFAEARRIIERLTRLQRPALSRSAQDDRRDLSMLEQTLLNATKSLLIDSGLEGERADRLEPRASVSRVLRKLNAPATSIARSARSLLDKLDLDDS